MIIPYYSDLPVTMVIPSYAELQVQWQIARAEILAKDAEIKRLNAELTALRAGPHRRDRDGECVFAASNEVGKMHISLGVVGEG